MACVSCLFSCEKPQVVTDRFEAGMELQADTKIFYTGETVVFRIEANHDFEIVRVDTDNEQIKQAFSLGSYSPKGGFVDFRISSLDVVRTGTVKFSVDVHCTSPEFTLTLSGDFMAVLLEEPRLEVITPEVLPGGTCRVRVLSSYDRLQVVSLESPFVFSSVRKGSVIELRDGSAEFESDALGSVSSDISGKVRLTVFVDESDREYALEGDCSVYMPLSAELDIPAGMEYDKPFSFSIRANRAFKVETFSMNLSSERGMSDPSVSKSNAATDGGRFEVGGVYTPGSDGMVHVSISEKYIDIEADHEGYVALELSSADRSTDRVSLEKGYTAKAREPEPPAPVIVPEGIEVTLDGKVFSGTDVVRLVSGQEMNLGVRVLPEGAVGDLVVAMEDEDKEVLSLVTSGNEVSGLTRKLVAGDSYGAAALVLKCGDVTRKIDFYVRRRVALVVNILCKEDFRLANYFIKNDGSTYSNFCWDGLPFSMEMSLCSWKGEDKLAALADSRVYPDLSDFSFQGLEGTYSGKVKASLSLQVRPVSLTSDYFALDGKMYRAVGGDRGNIREAHFHSYNNAVSADVPPVQSYEFLESGSGLVQVTQGQGLDSGDILSWLYFHDDYMTENDAQSGQKRVVHASDWQDIRLVPESIDYNHDILDVRYVVFRYQFKSGGVFANKIVPYWLTENYNSPAVYTWKK